MRREPASSQNEISCPKTQQLVPKVVPKFQFGDKAGRGFYVLAADRVLDLHFTGNTQCLPLYRYTDDGERVCNITEWGIRRFNYHFRQEWGDAFDKQASPEGITAEDIFAYTYAVLHNPAYRHDYRVDLLREFPRLSFYQDFHVWRDMGRELLDLHVGFEQAEPYRLERVDTWRVNLDGLSFGPIRRRAPSSWTEKLH